MNDTITLRTSIRPKLKQFLLFRGSLLAFSGVSLILYAGVFVGPKALSHWGLSLCFVAFLMMAWGLIPYRRASKMEEQPSELIISEDLSVRYRKQGKESTSFSLRDVDEAIFCEEKGLYGMGLKFKIKERVPTVTPSLIFTLYSHSLKRKYAFDLFFPFFTERTVHEFQELMRPREDHR